MHLHPLPFYAALLLLPVVSAHANAPLSEPTSFEQENALPAYLGSWKGLPSEKPVAAFLWLEPQRVGWFGKDGPAYYRARYGEARAVLERWGSLTQLELRLDGEQLVARLGEREQRYERSQQIPEALLAEPYPLPESPEIEPFLLETIQLDLAERRREDQAVRQNNRPSSNMRSVDEENTAYLVELISEFGWVDAERFGPEAADAAFLLVQHSSDLRLMRTALPLIEKDVRAGRLGGQAFALLHDRLQLRLGGVQRYGSQIGILKDGRSVLMPCEDPEAVDTHRKEMGMGPLADYLKLFEEDDQKVLTLEEALGDELKP